MELLTFLIDLDFFSNPQFWMAILTLVFLEIVLGIDNIVFISIVSNKLPKAQQPKARNIGLLLAMVFRILLLFGITWVLQLTKPLFEFDWNWATGGITGQSLILVAGGIFLLYKSVKEIHHKLEGDDDHSTATQANKVITAIIQIAVLDMVFAFDSILTAVGMISLEAPPTGFGYNVGLGIMITAVVIAIIVMILFAGPVSDFVNQHPTIQILGLSFLILIGVMLLAEGSHKANIVLFNDVQVHNIPKGYLYFAIFFSLLVEFLNLRMNKKRNPVKLRNSTIVDEELKDTELFD